MNKMNSLVVLMLTLVMLTPMTFATDIYKDTQIVIESPNGIYVPFGNVGIGTITPQYKIDVAGAINAYNIMINGSPMSNTGNVTGIGIEGYIPQFAGNRVLNSSVIFQNGTNIGIGTTAPGNKLDILGSDWSLGQTVRIRTSGTVGASLIFNGPWANVVLEPTLGGPAGTNMFRFNSADTGDMAVAYAWNNNNLERMRIDTNGNVGIGTTSPVALLHINSSNAAGALRVENTTGSPLFFVNGTSGNVGIGTTGPGAKLHLRSVSASEVSTDFGIRIDQNSVNSGASSIVDFYEGSTQKGYIRQGSSGFIGVGGVYAIEMTNVQNAPILFSTNNLERIRILGSGSVGIGTTSPTALLEVNGTNIANNLSLNVNNTLYVNASRVGIGTTSPISRLHAVGSAVFDGGVLTATRVDPNGFTHQAIVMGPTIDSYRLALAIGGSRAVADTSLAELSFHSFNTDNTLGTTVGATIRGLSEDAITTNYGINLAFFTRTGVGSLTERMRILGTGSVGIGTSSPGATLHVNGTGITAPGNGTDSERFGLNAEANATRSIAIGNAAKVLTTGFGLGVNSIAIGSGAISRNSASVVIGRAADEGTSNIAGNNVIIGAGAHLIN